MRAYENKLLRFPAVGLFVTACLSMTGCVIPGDDFSDVKQDFTHPAHRVIQNHSIRATPLQLADSLPPAAMARRGDV